MRFLLGSFGAVSQECHTLVSHDAGDVGNIGSLLLMAGSGSQLFDTLDWPVYCLESLSFGSDSNDRSSLSWKAAIVVDVAHWNVLA